MEQGCWGCPGGGGRVGTRSGQGGAEDTRPCRAAVLSVSTTTRQPPLSPGASPSPSLLSSSAAHIPQNCRLRSFPYLPWSGKAVVGRVELSSL